MQKVASAGGFFKRAIFRCRVVGPFLADHILGATSDTKASPASDQAGNDVSNRLPELLQADASLWTKAESHLYPDSETAQYEEKARAAGAIAFFRKPVDFDALEAVIRRELAEEKPPAEKPS